MRGQEGQQGRVQAVGQNALVENKGEAQALGCRGHGGGPYASRQAQRQAPDHGRRAERQDHLQSDQKPIPGAAEQHLEQGDQGRVPDDPECRQGKQLGMQVKRPEPITPGQDGVGEQHVVVTVRQEDRAQDGEEAGLHGGQDDKHRP